MGADTEDNDSLDQLAKVLQFANRVKCSVRVPPLSVDFEDSESFAAQVDEVNERLWETVEMFGVVAEVLARVVRELDGNKRSTVQVKGMLERFLSEFDSTLRVMSDWQLKSQEMVSEIMREFRTAVQRISKAQKMIELRLDSLEAKSNPHI